MVRYNTGRRKRKQEEQSKFLKICKPRSNGRNTIQEQNQDQTFLSKREVVKTELTDDPAFLSYLLYVLRRGTQ